MWHVLAAIRLAGMVVVLLVGVLLSLFIGLMSRQVFCSILSAWYRAMLFCLGIRVEMRGDIPQQASLVVANHISWADILVIGSRMPLAFLAMQEVTRWPVIGRLAQRAGTLFIERGNGAPMAIDQVASCLQQGRGVVIFPEGRTSDGATVKRFHARIFEAAIKAGKSVTPVGLVYHNAVTGERPLKRISFATGNFIESVWATAAGPGIIASIEIFPAMQPGDDRQQLAKQAFQQINSHVSVTLNASEMS